MRRLSTQEIYDCLDDDSAFALLPGRVAAAVGARSAVFHWRSQDGGPLVLADSGYWSPERMGEYVDHFAEHDIWAQSTLTTRTQNQLWAIDELVPERIYGNSVFYNEWIRAMGDDTYHCAGMSMAGPSGTGLIGLHRARASGAFAADDLARLNEHIGPIRRLMRVRGILAEARDETRLLGDALDGLGIDVMIVRRDGRLMRANGPAAGRLSAGMPLTIAAGRLTSRDPATERTIRTAIDRATDRAAPDASFVRIALGDAGFAIMTVAPMRHEGNRAAMLTLRQPRAADLPHRLKRLFGLTPAEAAIAVGVSQGHSLSDIAADRKASVQTVRTQLKLASEKMGCRSQAEVAALIARI